jgi:hypothetical protein
MTEEPAVEGPKEPPSETERDAMAPVPLDASRCEPTTCSNDGPLAVRDVDEDGVLDVYDPDDDNDGVSDQQECALAGAQGLVNGGFEVPSIGQRETFRTLAVWDVPGWRAVPDGATLELWTDGHLGVAATPGGRQFAELNSDLRTGIYQDFVVTPGTRLRWAFSHRGRVVADTVRILLGTAVSMLPQGEFVTAPGVWQTYAGIYEVPGDQAQTRIMLEAVSGDTKANLVDDVWVEPVCDLDRDGDGCVDSDDADTEDPACP